MRRAVALVLAVALLSGCYTTARTVALADSPPVAAPGRSIVGLVLRDGTEVRFVEAAALSADGTVTGLVEAELEGMRRPGTARGRRSGRGGLDRDPVAELLSRGACGLGGVVATR